MSTTDETTADVQQADLPDQPEHMKDPAARNGRRGILEAVRASTNMPATQARTLMAVVAVHAQDQREGGPLISEEPLAALVGVKDCRTILHTLADLGWLERVPTLEGRRSRTRFRLAWEVR